MTGIYDVRDYGAVGDGKANDTAAIQKAIDSCDRGGGGTVVFANGRYLTGTLQLRSHLTLHLQAGATVLASPRMEDYQLDPTVSSCAFRYYLLWGVEVENVSIEGRGIIDGQGPEFWESDRMITVTALYPKEQRPGGLVYFKNSRRIKISDIEIRNSPAFTVWPIGCDDVVISGITIDNPRNGPNTDGLDIDCCRNVRISDCHINAGDDCIALKSDAGRLGRKQACENIVVTNCSLSSSTCGIRVGYEGDAPISNCTFSNLVIYDTHHAIDIVSIRPKLSQPFTTIEEGPVIENINFCNIIMDNVIRPIYIWLGQEVAGEMKGMIEKVSIRNVIAHATNSSYIGGMSGKDICGLQICGFKLVLGGEMAPDDKIPDVWGHDLKPWGFDIHHACDIQLRDIQVSWESAAGDWKGAIRCQEVKKLEIDSLAVRPFASDASVIELVNTRQVLIRNCYTEERTGIFLKISGERSANIVAMGNYLGLAESAFVLDTGLAEELLTNCGNILP